MEKGFSRRLFLKQNTLTGLATIVGFGLTPGLEAFGRNMQISKNPKSYEFQDTLESLGGMSLQELLDFHRRYLKEIYIPNWDRGIDWKYGGFDNSLAPGKEPNFEKKAMYYQGRGVWMFSYLYNNITHDKRHLEAAIKGRDFLVKNALVENYRWVSFLSRKGEKLSEPLDHYGDIYALQGLTELYKATKDEKDIDMAIGTAKSVMERLLSPSNLHIGAHADSLEPGTRRLPCWQHFLGALTPLLKVRRDPAIEKIARYCVRVICQDHWRPEYGVLLEMLDGQFKPYISDASSWGEFGLRGISGWHSIQACWMVMNEALRVMHQPTYRQGFEMGIAVLEKSYIEGKGIPEYNPEVKPDPNTIYPWGALDEMLVYCLTALEHSHDPVVINYYNKCFKLHNSQPEKVVTTGLLHTPRRFFYSIEILERMINRGGKVSGVFG